MKRSRRRNLSTVKKRDSRKIKKAKLHLESLEKKELLAFNVASIGWDSGTGILTLTDDSPNDSSQLTLGVESGEVTINGATTSILASSITQVDVIALEGDDTIDLSAIGSLGLVPAVVSVDAGAGNDVVFGGDVASTLVGGSGHDLLLGGSGHDVLIGDDGQDQLWGKGGNDQLFGGDQDDWLFGGLGDDSVLSGGDGDDHIRGGPGKDDALGGNGDDTYHGDLGPGADSWDGAPGYDVSLPEFDEFNSGPQYPVADTTPTFEWIGSTHSDILQSGQAIDLYEGSDVSFIVSALDLDGDELTYTIESSTFSNPVNVDPTTGVVTLTVPLSISNNHYDSHSFVVRATDEDGNSVDAMIPIRAINDPEIDIQLFDFSTSVTAPYPPILSVPKLYPGATVWAGDYAAGALQLEDEIGVVECQHAAEYGCVWENGTYFVYPSEITATAPVDVIPASSTVSVGSTGTDVVNVLTSPNRLQIVSGNQSSGIGSENETRFYDRITLTATAPNGRSVSEVRYNDKGVYSNTHSTWNTLTEGWELKHQLPSPQIAKDFDFSAVSSGGTQTFSLSVDVDAMADPTVDPIQFVGVPSFVGSHSNAAFQDYGPNNLDFEYTPPTDYYGVEEFEYKWTSGTGFFNRSELSNTGRIRVTVGEYDVTSVEVDDPTMPPIHHQCACGRMGIDSNTGDVRSRISLPGGQALLFAPPTAPTLARVKFEALTDADLLTRYANVFVREIGAPQGSEVLHHRYQYNTTAIPKGESGELTLPLYAEPNSAADALSTGQYEFFVTLDDSSNSVTLGKSSDFRANLFAHDDSGFGRGWGLVGDDRLISQDAIDDEFIVVSPGGGVLRYSRIGTDSWKAEGNVDGRLLEYDSDVDQYRITDKFGNESHFNSDGYTFRLSDRFDNVTEFIRDIDNRVTKVKIPRGENNSGVQIFEQLEFLDTEANFDGAFFERVEFGIFEEGNSIPLELTDLEFDYEPAFNDPYYPSLASVSRPEHGGDIGITYTDQGQLQAITDGFGSAGSVKQFVEYNNSGVIQMFTESDGFIELVETVLPSQMSRYENAMVVAPLASLAGFIQAPPAVLTSLDADDQTVEEKPLTSHLFEFDDAQRVGKRFDALGNQESFAYDRLGNRVFYQNDTDLESNRQELDGGAYEETTLQTVNGQLVETRATYDVLGNMTSMVYEIDQTQEVWEYDDISRVTMHQNREGFITYWYYEELGGGERITQVSTDLTMPLVPAISPPYPANWIVEVAELDKYGQMVKQIDGEGNETVYQYSTDRLLLESVTTAANDPTVSGLVTYGSHDVFGNAGEVTVFEEGVGRTTNYEYQHGQLISMTAPDPGFGQERLKTHYFYDDMGRQTRQTLAASTVDPSNFDSTNSITSKTVYQQDRAVESINDFGYGAEYFNATTKSHYDQLGRMVASEDANGFMTQYVYDRDGRMVSVIAPDPDGAETNGQSPVTYTIFDEFGQAVASVDANRNVTRSYYDEQFRLEKVRAGETVLAEYEYDVMGRAMNVYDTRGRRTHFDYDSFGRQVATYRSTPVVSDAPSDLMLTATETTYDNAGNVRFVTDTEGAVWEYQYDAQNRARFVVGPEVAVGIRPITETQYFTDGQVKKSRTLQSDDGTTQVWVDAEYVYDDAGRLRSTVFSPDSQNSNNRATTLQEYDVFGNVRRSQDAAGNWTLFFYDDLYRQGKIVSENPDGHPIENEAGPVTTFVYDIGGRLKEQTVKNAITGNQTITMVYDDLGRTIRQIMPHPTTGAGSTTSDPADGHTFVSYNYDAVGNVTSTVNSANESTSTEYGYIAGSYLPLVEINANDEPVRYFYDDLGRRFGLTDPPTDANPFGNTTTWLFDDHDRVTHEKKGSKRVRTFEYDSVGNLIYKTDARDRGIQYHRDELYRVTTEEWFAANGNSVREIDFDYDLSGNLKYASDPHHTYDYEYDALGRLDRQSHAVHGLPGQVAFEFDYFLNGQRRGVDASLERTATTSDFSRSYTYDSLNRLDTFTQSSSVGNTGEFGIKFNYDLLGQFDTIQRYTDSARSIPVAVTQYAFDLSSRLTGMEHLSGDDPQVGASIANYDWTFDAANRVDTFDSANDGLVDYGYDPSGQVESAVYTEHDGVFTNESYQYDEAGNRIQSTVETKQFDYDVHWPLDPANGTESMAYDATSNGINGTLVDNVNYVPSTAPIVGNTKALDFDGINDAVEATASELDFDGEFSISMWVNPDDAAAHRMTMFSQGNPKAQDGVGFALEYRNDWFTRPLDFYLNDGNGYSQVLSFVTDGQLTGDWHHVAVTVSQDQITLYIDGLALKATENLQSGTYNTVGEPLRLGAPASGGIEFFEGEIDDIRIYQQAVDPSEIAFASYGVASQAQVAEYQIFPFNQLKNDETYSYNYDLEGNLAKRTDLETGHFTKYIWDHRNRLTAVESFRPRERVLLSFESDDGNNAIDQIGSIEDGVLMGSAEVQAITSLTNPGQAALYLDGQGSYVRMGIQEGIPYGQEDYTLTAWIKPESTDFMQGIVTIGDVYDSGGYQLYYNGITGNEQLVFNVSDGTSAMQTLTYNLSATIQDTWSHVAVTFDVDGDISLLLDGSVVATVANNQDFSSTTLTSELVLGNVFDGSSIDFNGYIDDIRFFDEVLLSTDIADVSDNPAATKYRIQRITYSYDHQNQLIRRRDSDRTGTVLDSQSYIYDAGQMVLRFGNDDQVSHRYAWGPQVDQLLVDEQVATSGVAGDTLWSLTDNLGSVRDVVRYDSAEPNDVQVVAHRAYDSFGNVTVNDVTDDSIDGILFGYTGRQFDEVTGLQNNLNRWFDPRVGRWISEDPIGFEAGDSNLYRYVGNNATNLIDPSGLAANEGHHWVTVAVTNALLKSRVITHRMAEYFGGRFSGDLVGGHNNSKQHMDYDAAVERTVRKFRKLEKRPSNSQLEEFVDSIKEGKVPSKYANAADRKTIKCFNDDIRARMKAPEPQLSFAKTRKKGIVSFNTRARRRKWAIRLGLVSALMKIQSSAQDAKGVARILTKSKAMKEAIEAAEKGKIDSVKRHLTGWANEPPSVAEEMIYANIDKFFVQKFRETANKALDNAKKNMYQ